MRNFTGLVRPTTENLPARVAERLAFAAIQLASLRVADRLGRPARQQPSSCVGRDNESTGYQDQREGIHVAKRAGSRLRQSRHARQLGVVVENVVRPGVHAAVGVINSAWATVRIAGPARAAA